RDSRDVALEKRQDAHQIGEDDVGASGKGHPVGKPFEKLDSASAAVGGSNLARQLNNLSRLDGKDSFGAELACQHREDTRSRANFRDNGFLANSPSQRFRISVHANAIRNHRAIGSQAVHRDLSSNRGGVSRRVVVSSRGSAGIGSDHPEDVAWVMRRGPATNGDYG